MILLIDQQTTWRELPQRARPCRSSRSGFGWQFFRYQKQNVGMAALAASSRRVMPLRSAERRAVILAGHAGIAGLMARLG